MNEKLKNSFLFHLTIIFLLCVGLYFFFFASLGMITHHSSEIKVPKLVGKPLAKAYPELKRLQFDVDVDSTYDPTKKPFVVLNQSPQENAVVKQGRTIFLTVNKAVAPLAPMPKLQDLSYRSAIMVLKNSRFVLGDTIQKPNYADGAVLDQLYKGAHVDPGAMIPQGSKIDLVVGIGFGNSEMDVPDVIGLSAEEGIALLNGNGLIPIAVYDGEITDSATAIIYNQNPTSFNELNTQNKIKIGDVIDIRIKQSATTEELENNRKPASTVIEEQPAALPQ